VEAKTTSRTIAAMIAITSLLLLAGSWYHMFWALSAYIEQILVPWDMWTELAPPIGTWQRGTNDFFNAHAGHVAIGIIALSIGVFLLGARRAKQRALLPLVFASLNSVFLSFLFWIPALGWLLVEKWFIPVSSGRPDPGYHRNWLAFAFFCVILMLFFWAQWKVIALWDRLRLISNGEDTQEGSTQVQPPGQHQQASSKHLPLMVIWILLLLLWQSRPLLLR
jgi:hypothetical protein